MKTGMSRSGGTSLHIFMATGNVKYKKTKATAYSIYYVLTRKSTVIDCFTGLLYHIVCSWAVSSAGESAGLTYQRSLVRIQYRPFDVEGRCRDIADGAA